MRLPRLRVQTESSDCAFAVLATLLEHYTPGYKVNTVSLRNLYGEGEAGITVTGYLRLLGKFGFDVVPVVYNRDVVVSQSGLYVACEETYHAGHITIIASKGDGRAYRADMLGGRWREVPVEYRPTMLIIIRGYTPAAELLESSIRPSAPSLASRCQPALLAALLCAIPTILPMVSIYVYSKLDASFNIVKGLSQPWLRTLFLVAYITALAIMTQLVLRSMVVPEMLTRYREVLEDLCRRTLDLFRQRASYELNGYLVDAVKVAERRMYTIPALLGNTIAIVFNTAICISVIPLSVLFIVVAIEIGACGALLVAYAKVNVLHERSRTAKGLSDCAVMGILGNPLGILYMNTPVWQQRHLVGCIHHWMEQESRWEAARTLLHSVRSMILYVSAVAGSIAASRLLNNPGASIMLSAQIIAGTFNISQITDAFNEARISARSVSRLSELFRCRHRLPRYRAHAPVDEAVAPRIRIRGDNGCGKSVYFQYRAGLTERIHLVAPQTRCFLDRALSQSGVGPTHAANTMYIDHRFHPYATTFREALLARGVCGSDTSLSVLLGNVDSIDSAKLLDRQLCGDHVALSRGEAQRLSLVYAIATAPDTLILDEALSGIPARDRAICLSLLNEALPKTTIVYIDHETTHYGDMWSAELDIPT